jgi:hypothetical protein
MSKEKMPVLAGVIPTFEHFMTAWEQLSDKNPHLRVAINRGLLFANKYYKKMDETKAYILAMCKCNSIQFDDALLFPVIHPGIRLSWIKQHWGATFLADAEKKIKETVRHPLFLQHELAHS